MQVLELEDGQLFRILCQGNKDYEVYVKVSDVTDKEGGIQNCIVRRVLSRMLKNPAVSMDEWTEWRLVKAMDENCNPYAEVDLLRVDIGVESEKEQPRSSFPAQPADQPLTT